MPPPLSAREDVLAAALAVLTPTCPPALFSPEALAALRRQTPLLAPVVRLGLECRLAEGNGQVDLQQCLQPAEATLLAEHLASVTAGATACPPAWHHLQRFARAWADPTSALHHALVEVWLEFDLPPDQPPLSHPPAVFVGFREPATLDTLSLVLTALRGRPPAPVLRNHLARCLAAAQGRADLSHVGLMLSRPGEALRLNLYWHSPEPLFPFLEAAGWRGPADVLRPLADTLRSHSDGLMVDLDVGEAVYPTLGLEAFFDRQPSHEPRWATLLDRLIAAGLCTPAKRDAVLAWPGHVSPPTAPAPWPAAFLTASLLAPPDHFTTLGRLVNHLKVSLHPTRGPEAKAYLGYGHLWTPPRHYPS